MKYYAGLDVSLEETAICLVDEDGAIVKETVSATSPESIAAVLRDFGFSLDRVGLEVGGNAAWLYEGLRGGGFPAVVIDAVHAAAMLKSGFRNKTDRNDARGIADMMRVNKFRAVWIKSPAGRDRRALLAAREQLVKMRTALTNTLRGLLRGRGLCMKPGSRRNLIAALRALVQGDPALGEIFSPLLATLDVVEREIAGFDRRVLERAKGDEVCRLLMTRPGVGPIVALSFRAGVDDPNRFRRSRDVGAYFGLTPRRHQSGAMDYSGHISHMGDQAVRRALYMAAHTIMRGGPRDSLSAWALNLAKRRGAKRAKVALARRLAVILHRMWLDGTPYRPDHPAANRKAA